MHVYAYTYDSMYNLEASTGLVQDVHLILRTDGTLHGVQQRCDNFRFIFTAITPENTFGEGMDTVHLDKVGN